MWQTCNYANFPLWIRLFSDWLLAQIQSEFVDFWYVCVCVGGALVHLTSGLYPDILNCIPICECEIRDEIIYGAWEMQNPLAFKEDRCPKDLIWTKIVFS